MDDHGRTKRIGPDGVADFVQSAIRGKWLVLACGLSLCAGCFTPGVAPGKLGEPELAPVSQVQAAWRNEVVVTADVVHQGAPLPGLAGRVYLFGPDAGRPVKGDGKVIVDLYDLGKFGQKGQPKMVQRFIFDPKTLERLFRRDLIGWGYTLFLPWPDYRPETDRILLKVWYQPVKGTPVFAPDSRVSLRNKESTSIKETVTAVPVGQASASPGNGDRTQTGDGQRAAGSGDPRRAQAAGSGDPRRAPDGKDEGGRMKDENKQDAGSPFIIPPSSLRGTQKPGAGTTPNF